MVDIDASVYYFLNYANYGDNFKKSKSTSFQAIYMMIFRHPTNPNIICT